MEIVGVDNFDLDLSSFKKIINDNSIFFSNFISQFKEPYRIWDLFTTPPNGPFILPIKLKKYTNL